MVVGDIEQDALVWVRVCPMKGAYRISILIEQGGVGPRREYVSWMTRLIPPPDIAPGEVLDMALEWNAEIDATVNQVGLRIGLLDYFGFEEPDII